MDTYIYTAPKKPLIEVSSCCSANVYEGGRCMECKEGCSVEEIEED